MSTAHKPVSGFSKPMAVDALDVVFGGTISKLLPPMSAIPAEFKRHNGTEWNRWQADWFYSGLHRYPKPKPGIEVREAMRHLAAVQGSFEPKHEHKEAGVAYLASLWFDGPDGEPIPARATTQGATT
jgi:hypothetical protein